MTGIQGLGGAIGTSNSYEAGVTLGSSPAGKGSSANYESCLGYWCGEASKASKVV